MHGFPMCGRDFHLVNDERLIGHDRFVPRRQKCAGQEAKDFIGAIAKNDLLRRSPSNGRQ